MHNTGSGTGPGTRTGGRLHESPFMGFNNIPHDPARIDLELNRNQAELWSISAPVMAHPFHVHGVAFRVLSRNGTPVDFAIEGLKDVTLVRGQTEILVMPKHVASPDLPYMYHCHILEHEDAGMMGQFSVL